MSHGTFLQDLAVVMIVAGMVTILCHRFKQPVVLGYILAGLIIGPHTPPFPLVNDQKTIETLAELGVTFLMFSLGLHFSLRQLKKVGASVLITGILELPFMIAIGYGLGQTFGWGFMDSLFLGGIMAISSTTIVVKTLEALGQARESFASLIFGILVVEDILAIALLALLSGVALTGSTSVYTAVLTIGELLLFLVAVVVIGLLLVPRLLRYVARFRSDEMLLISVLGLCFGVSLLAARLEFSVALGAFLMGAVIAEAREASRIQRLIEPLRDLFSAIFFVAVGMLIQPALVWEYAGPIAAVTTAVIVGKVMTCTVGSLVAGSDLRTSLKVGVGLAQIGEFSFIIASLGLTLGVTSPFLYPVAVSVSAVTSLLSPYLIRAADPLIARFEQRAPRALMSYLSFYRRAIQGLRQGGPRSEVSRLLQRAGLQILLNAVLMTGIFVAAGWYARQTLQGTLLFPAWLGGNSSLAWLGATLLALPLLVATFRKLQAAGMLMAELRIRGGRPAWQTGAARAVLSNTILLLGMAAVCAWLLMVGWAMLPPWPAILMLLIPIVALMGFLWSPLVKLYTSAQVALRETFEDEAPLEAPLAPPTFLPPAFAEARLETVQLQEGFRWVGMQIREIQVRSQTGATIVGLEREGVAMVNPSPEERLLTGDKLLLLGNAWQLEAGISFLEET